MMEHLRRLARTHFAAAPSTNDDGPDDIAVAAAGLLIEAARLDGRYDADERATVAALVGRRFDLAGPARERVVAQAETLADETADHHRFTRVLKDGLDEAERIELIEMLWEVVYADGVLHDHEANLLRRVAGLLYVGDRATGEARKRVLDRLGLKG